MLEERWNYLSIFPMEIYITKSLSYGKIIKEYAALKVGKCSYVRQFININSILLLWIL